MSGRYIGFIGFDEARLCNPPMGFREVLKTGRVTLFANGQLDFAPAQTGGYGILGVALGKRPTTDRPETPKALLDTYWGMYLGVKTEPDAETRFVRDPSGHLPCYYMADGKGWIIASDLDLLRTATVSTIAIDWAEVGDALLFVNHFSARTALSGIYELLPGEELVVAGDRLQINGIWSPWQHALYPIPNMPDAVAQLHDALDRVHTAVADHFPSPLITVSGGLDSAIVATEIARHTKAAKHLTFFTEKDRLGDERSFARTVAAACDAPIAVAIYTAPDFEISCRSEMFLPRPTHRSIAALINMKIADQAFLGGHTAILGGFGGDNIFNASAAPYALRDRLASGASFTDIITTLGDVRRLTSASYRGALRHGVKMSMQRKKESSRYLWPREPGFLTAPIAARTTPEITHPWLDAPDSAMAGSTAHIASLIGSHNYLERVPRGARASHVWPLLLSPVVEACLAIPSWLWCAGGIDRAIARLAATRLPALIANRRAKGSPMQMHARYFEANRLAIATYLSDGLLAQQGIVDAAAIRTYCTRPPPVTDLHYLRILELVDAEIWCRFQSE